MRETAVPTESDTTRGPSIAVVRADAARGGVLPIRRTLAALELLIGDEPALASGVGDADAERLAWIIKMLRCVLIFLRFFSWVSPLWYRARKRAHVRRYMRARTTAPEPEPASVSEASNGDSGASAASATTTTADSSGADLEHGRRPERPPIGMLIALQCGHNAPYTEGDRSKLNHVLTQHGWLNPGQQPNTSNV